VSSHPTSGVSVRAQGSGCLPQSFGATRSLEDYSLWHTPSKFHFFAKPRCGNITTFRASPCRDVLVLLPTFFPFSKQSVVQGLMGWPGCIVCAFWFIANSIWAPEPSIGSPGYVYPNDEICELYDGIPCTSTGDTCCYNEELWCPSDDNCRADVSAP
jgi:hypothetical protein